MDESRRMFYQLGKNISYDTFSPYDPSLSGTGSMPNGGGLSGLPGGISARQTGGFDLIPNPSFVPRRDIVNGSGPANSGWHTAANSLPSDPTLPFYIARDLGPKYLYKDGPYQIIHSLSTARQSGNNVFTLSFIVMAAKPANTTVPLQKFTGHAGFRVEEGLMTLEVEGYAPAQLSWGDVAFIPGGTSYRYYSTVPYTKVLHFAAEANGLDSTLIAKSTAWNSPVWPIK
jgi:hypothetical protein